jgi:predicted site-specific integrase-resolvase
MMTDKPLVPLVTIEGVAEHFVVSVATVRTWLRNGTIPRDTYLKVGNTYRFDLSKLADALLNAPKKPVQLEMNFDNENDN